MRNAECGVRSEKIDSGDRGGIKCGTRNAELGSLKCGARNAECGATAGKRRGQRQKRGRGSVKDGIGGYGAFI